MDLGANDLDVLSKALKSNSAVLFLGAGFSLDALNKLKASIPTGNQFAEQLWPLTGIAAPYDNAPLTKVFEAARRGRHEPLRELLQNTFICESFADWYRIVPGIFWNRIYTTNIDSLVEEIYRGASAAPRLKVFNGLFEDYAERDQFLESIQYIKLNGTYTDSPNDLTFSFRQFSRRAAENTLWYDQLIRDYATKTTIFVGTELNEPLMWSALELRGKRVRGSEGRPRSYIVRPNLSAIDEQNFKELNIHPIRSTAKEFFEYVAGSIGALPSRDELLGSLIPSLRLLPAGGNRISTAERRALEAFYTAFYPVQLPESPKSTRKSFLLGASPDWPSIYNNLDARRDCGLQYAKEIEGLFKEREPRTIALTGYAGSGKSTVLKRLALDVGSLGIPVFFAESEDIPPAHQFASAIAALPSRSLIIIDNASNFGSRILDYSNVCRTSDLRHIMLMGERSNKIQGMTRRLNDIMPLVQWRIPELSTNDINRLIDKLDQNHLLGELQGKRREEQVDAFAVRARKQILVAMKEATSGKDFDEIISNEFHTLQVRETQYLYLCVCIATDAQFSLTKQQLIACTMVSPAETLAFVKDELLEMLVTESGSNDRFTARHRVIASSIVDKLVAREMLKTAYIRILQTVSHDMSFPINRNSRIFKMYQRIISHESIYRRFQNHVDEARAIYESIAAYYKRDHHFWLQYGSLELEYGELTLAANYISQAESLNPHDDFVQTSKAYLLYKQAVSESRHEAACMYREQAREILERQIESRPDDRYPAQILCAQELHWIGRWLATEREKRKKALGELKDLAERLAPRFSYSQEFQKIKTAIVDEFWALTRS
jgi:tetratricopeptide (TPR) repeat protein